jgi:hypothetical protein
VTVLGDEGRAEAREALHRAFRPQRARTIAWVIGAVELVALTALALLLPATGPTAFHWYDRLGVILVGVFVAFTLSRFVRLAALPDEQGLTVRNVVYTRRLDWAQVVAVRFGGGNPWATLDLSDGETLAVMAVQRADGARAATEAGRLATLVELHSRTHRDG